MLRKFAACATIVLLSAIAAPNLVSGAGAADPTPQQIVAFKVAYNVRPLTATDSYVFYLMVRSVASSTDIPDSVITKAVADYNAGDPSTLKLLPTSLDESVDISSANGGILASAGIPSCGNPGYVWGFTIRVKSVVGATLFSDGYNIWWKSFCGAVVNGVVANILHDTTNLGAITGWSFNDFNPNTKFYFTWNGYANGGFHHEWYANWDRCISIPLVGTYCLGDYHVHEHVDIFADGVGCLQGTGQSTRKCWYALYGG